MKEQKRVGVRGVEWLMANGTQEELDRLEQSMDLIASVAETSEIWATVEEVVVEYGGIRLRYIDKKTGMSLGLAYHEEMDKDLFERGRPGVGDELWVLKNKFQEVQKAEVVIAAGRD